MLMDSNFSALAKFSLHVKLGNVQMVINICLSYHDIVLCPCWLELSETVKSDMQ